MHTEPVFLSLSNAVSTLYEFFVPYLKTLSHILIIWRKK